MTFPLATLGSIATTFTDLTAPNGPNCYALVVTSAAGQYFSDLLCALVGFHTPIGSPQAFTLQLNQSSTANFAWAQPVGGGQDSYDLLMIGGSGQILTAGTTSASLPASGMTCYVLGALRGADILGYTDLHCGLPGFSNLPEL